MFDDVKTGDTVVLHLRDGRRVEITVAQIESDAVVSAEGVRYPHDDIAQLQKRSVSGVRTVGILTAAFFGFIALIGIALEVLW